MVAKNTSRRLSNLGEFGLIDTLTKNLHLLKNVVKGVGDDTAVLEYTSKKYQLFTTDMMVEDVHFRRNDSAVAVGQKALACNISDIAAMGGVPTFAVISIGLPKGLPVDYVKKMYRGLEQRAKEFGISIVGGDTVSAEKIVINVALMGEVGKRNLVTRAGAKAGDWIFTTGPLGKSLSTKHHLTFKPRLKESQYIVKHFRPTAMLDISDGLAPDLGHILKESKVGARLKEGKIPRRTKASVKEALYDGEDFELLFTLSPAVVKKGIPTSRVQLYHIGEITNQKGKLVLLDQNLQARTISTKGFEHF